MKIQTASTQDILGSHICAEELEACLVKPPKPQDGEPWSVLIIESKVGWFFMHRVAEQDGLIVGVQIGYCPFCGQELNAEEKLDS